MLTNKEYNKTIHRNINKIIILIQVVNKLYTKTN